MAYCVDIDPQALTATHDNAIKNNVADKIHAFLPDDFTPFKADVVLANILAKPLIDLSCSICELVKENGALVLSGILAEQADSVICAYAEKIAFAPRVQQEDWIRLNGNKR
jgi:ribosomal protein L11 methyltransferase